MPNFLCLFQAKTSGNFENFHLKDLPWNYAKSALGMFDFWFWGYLRPFEAILGHLKQFFPKNTKMKYNMKKLNKTNHILKVKTSLKYIIHFWPPRSFEATEGHFLLTYCTVYMCADRFTCVQSLDVGKLRLINFTITSVVK